MKLTRPRVEFFDIEETDKICKRIERAGRTCYKSEDKITEDSAKKFCRAMVKNGHEAMLEHETISVHVVCDRAIANEIVRHRVASYAQESTRYCNYGKDKFDNQITCIYPFDGEEADENLQTVIDAYLACENCYLALVANGVAPEIARSVLPLGLKTEIFMTMNIREWRHFLKLRYRGETGRPHPQIKEIAREIAVTFATHIPELFGDLILDEDKGVVEERVKETE